MLLAFAACTSGERTTSPELATQFPPSFAEQGSAPTDRYASIFARVGKDQAGCEDLSALGDAPLADQVRACPGAEEFARERGAPGATPKQREMWWELARAHATDCAVLSNAASWLAPRPGKDMDRRMAQGDPNLARRYWESGVVATVAARSRSLEAVQCAAEVILPLPSQLDGLHALWLYRAGWISLYGGKMTSYQRVHEELAQREGAFDLFVYSHLEGLEALRGGDVAKAEKMLVESVRRHPKELLATLSGPSLLVREFWVRERVDIVVEYLETYAELVGDNAWAQTSLESVLAGRLPDDGWL